jgi:DNA-binding CsgD family transcriptional regulator/tetratricopeptide (TPR) repeat protein
MRQEHAAYYLRLAEAATPHLFGAEQMAWLNHLERDYENLRAAWDWFQRQGELEAVLRFCAALWPFWWIHGHLSEGYALMESTLVAPAPLLEALRAQVYIGAGVLAYEQGRAQKAQQCCAAGLALARQQGAPRACIIALRVLGRVACVTGDYLMARGYAEEALVFARQSGDAWDLTSALETLVVVTRDEGKDDEVRPLGEAYLAAARQTQDSRALARALFHVGSIYWFAGELQVSQMLLEECLVCARAVGDVITICGALLLLGGVGGFQSEEIRSLELLEEEGALVQKQDPREIVALVSLRMGKGMSALNQGQYLLAHVRLAESLRLLRHQNESYNIYRVICLDMLGAVAAAQELLVWAARLWGATRTACTAGGMALPAVVRRFVDPWRAKVHASLGETAFQAALAEGRFWSLRQALEAAERLPPPPDLSVPELSLSASVSKTARLPAGLTAREGEVLQLVAQGLTTAQIATRLVISRRTVTTHLTSIYSKLGINSRARAACFAAEHGLV